MRLVRTAVGIREGCKNRELVRKRTMERTPSTKSARMLALMLGCLTAGAAVPVCAQTTTPPQKSSQSQPAPRRPRQVVVLNQVEPRPAVPATSLGSVSGTASGAQWIKGTPWIPGIQGMAVQSPEAPSIRRVTVRLDEPSEPPAKGAGDWVDLAIPQDYFEDAKIAPRAVDLPKPQEASEPATQIPLEDILQPQVDSVPQPQVNAAPRAQYSGDPRSTFTPEQAIPDWILEEAGQSPSILEPNNLGNERRVEETDSLPPSLQPPASTQEPALLQRQAVPGKIPAAELIDPGQIAGQSGQERAGEGPSKGPDSPANSASFFPVLSPPEFHPAHVDAAARKTDYFESDFSPQGGPQGSTFDPQAALDVYRGKFPVPVQRPWIELWRPLYTSGIYPPALTWFGVTNPMKPHFLVYGDMRTVVGANTNAAGKSNAWGNVLNLDMDLQLTSTERLHAFVAPLNRGTQATGLAFNDEVDFVDGANLDLVTLFFEGDMGALTGGATGRYPPFDLPFTFGLIPLVYQNGIWANDAVLGAAVALPARHSRQLRWSNFDASFFWATDNITTDAFPGQDSASDFFGTAWFIDAYEGYIETGYAFVNDNTGAGRGYHNLAFAFTRRYLAKVSNSVRFIINLGQEDLPVADRTADGHLLLIENSFITAYPNTVVPYLNLFYGQGSPQSLARVGLAGGILNNTGINFETDGITGYPTLDATGHNTFGFAAGINLLGSQFTHQLVLETAMLKAVGSPLLRNAEGDQYALGLRYQKPLSHNLIFRTDHMVGFRESAGNLNGSRVELRWKF